MRRHFVAVQSMGLLAAFLAAREILALMNRYVSLKIRQPEIHASVAAVGRAEQREERLVLIDRYQLLVAKRPTLWREAEAHDSDFGKEWFSHVGEVG